jgi:hypothetical protein
MAVIVNASLMLALCAQFIIHVLEDHLKSFLLNMPINSEHQFGKMISSVQDNVLW